MPDLSWKSKYELGIPMMDEQHKRLFFLLTQLRQSVTGRLGREQVDTILQSLIVQTAEHLHTEEVLMTQMGFPDLPAHKAAHEKLLSGLHGLDLRFKEGDASMALLVTTFLGGWLRTHIALEDRAYATFLEDQEQSRSA
jgi:hemerythrin